MTYCYTPTGARVTAVSLLAEEMPGLTNAALEQLGFSIQVSEQEARIDGKDGGSFRATYNFCFDWLSLLDRVGAGKAIEHAIDKAVSHGLKKLLAKYPPNSTQMAEGLRDLYVATTQKLVLAADLLIARLMRAGLSDDLADAVGSAMHQRIDGIIKKGRDYLETLLNGPGTGTADGLRDLAGSVFGNLVRELLGRFIWCDGLKVWEPQVAVTVEAGGSVIWEPDVKPITPLLTARRTL